MAPRFVKLSSKPKSHPTDTPSKASKRVPKKRAAERTNTRQVRVERKPKKRRVKKRKDNYVDDDDEEEKMPKITELVSCSREWQAKRYESLDDTIPYPNLYCCNVNQTVVDKSYCWSLIDKPEQSKLTTADIKGSKEQMAHFDPDVVGTYGLELSITVAGNTFKEFKERRVVAHDSTVKEED